MKRIFLSRAEKKIAGVCGGLAEYFELDPTLVRLIVIILGIATAFAPIIIGYILAWIIIPQRPAESTNSAP
jgi:phage shock protein C